MMRKKYSSTYKPLRLILFLSLFLLLLAACGGADVDEAVENIGESDASDVDNTTDSETIEDENIDATGSEEDSGEIPPTPEPGSKVESPRTPSDEPISANLTTLANRIESGETAVSHRSNQSGPTIIDQPTNIPFVNRTTPTEWQKRCQLAQATNKKRCD